MQSDVTVLLLTCVISSQAGEVTDKCFSTVLSKIVYLLLNSPKGPLNLGIEIRFPPDCFYSESSVLLQFEIHTHRKGGKIRFISHEGMFASLRLSELYEGKFEFWSYHVDLLSVCCQMRVWLKQTQFTKRAIFNNQYTRILSSVYE